jgi:hypothetical protein
MTLGCQVHHPIGAKIREGGLKDFPVTYISLEKMIIRAARHSVE